MKEKKKQQLTKHIKEMSNADDWKNSSSKQFEFFSTGKNYKGLLAFLNSSL